MARPSTFSEKVAADICARLVCGESLSAICSDEELPDVSTVYRWIAANEAFRDMYARAREDQADTLADEILKIADESPAVSISERSGEAITTVDGAAVQHQRLRIDARKWIAAKLRPKKYGDRVDLEHSGGIRVLSLDDADRRA